LKEIKDGVKCTFKVKSNSSVSIMLLYDKTEKDCESYEILFNKKETMIMKNKELMQTKNVSFLSNDFSKIAISLINGVL